MATLAVDYTAAESSADSDASASAALASESASTAGAAFSTLPSALADSGLGAEASSAVAPPLSLNRFNSKRRIQMINQSSDIHFLNAVAIVGF